MKKQRVFAALLCLMMMVTTIPMVAMAAPASDETFDTMDAVLSAYGVNTNYAVNAYWSMLEKINTGATGFQTAPSGAIIDPEKGTYINSNVSNGYFRYNNGDPLWSSLETKARFVYFKAQLSETDKLQVLVQDPIGARKRGYFTISATAFGFGIFGSYYTREGGVGTGMNEYLIFNDYDGIVKLFFKGESTGNKWMLAVNAHTFGEEGSTGNGLYFSGTGYVKDVTLYGPAVTYVDVETIVGEKLYNIPAYEKSDEITIPTQATKHSSGRQLSIEEGMVPVVRAKLDSEDSAMRIVLRKPGETSANYTSYEFTVTPNLVKTEAVSNFVSEGFRFTDYVDYALLATKTECKLYVRSDKVFGGKWIHVLTDKVAYSSDNSYSATPVILPDAGSATVNYIKIYQHADSFATLEEAIGGSVIVEQTFTNFMRHTPTDTYSPLENGGVTFNATADEEGTAIGVLVHDPSTTKNAYGFKFTKDGFATADAASATKQTVVLDAGFVPGTAAHDYLVIENKATDGIVVYVKSEDGVWNPVYGINGHALSTPNQRTYGLYIHNSDGNAKLNLATIYTKDSLVLVDGGNNAALYGSENTLASAGSNLLVRGNGATGKLLVVSYKGENMEKAQIVNASDVAADGQTFDVAADGVTKVKVFHWDSLSSLNRLTPAVTLNYPQ